MSVGSLIAVVVLLGVAGCAHRSAEHVSVDELNRTVESLRAQNGVYAKQVEELENRVFILTDQLESRKVNAEKVATPELPIITLKPRDTPADEPEAAPADGDVDQPSVEYVGEAAKTSGARPLLRLHGEEATVILPSAKEPKPIVVSGERGTRSVAQTRVAVAPKPNESALGLYRRSLDALRAGRHDDAKVGFRDFLHAYAGHELADNAQYWLGECHYDLKDLTAAVRDFRQVVERYPNGNKVPDALLKLGYSYVALGSTEAARHTLEQLIRSYPRHEAAALASTKLVELNARAARSGEEVP